MKNWYAVSTYTRTEVSTAQNIARKIISTEISPYFSQVFVPCRKKSIITPGVIYVHMEYNNNLRSIIKSIKHVIDILPIIKPQFISPKPKKYSNSTGYIEYISPVPVSNEEMNKLFLISDKTYLININ